MKAHQPFKKLPDAEFDVMKVIWSLESPATTNQILYCLEEEKEWKSQTLATLLSRLVERGFLSTQKAGKERSYISLVQKDEYLQFETNQFVKQYHNSSFIHLANAFYGDRPLSNQEIDDLLLWVKERGD